MMATMSFEVDEATIDVLGETLKPIHPAIDVVDGQAYVGIWLNCRVRKKNRVYFRPMPFLKRSDGTIILYHNSQLLELGLRASYQPVEYENCWTGEILDDVNPAEVYNEVRDNVEYYMDLMLKEEYDLVALMVVLTYFVHLFETTPYALLWGTKRSCKTKLLKLMCCMSFNGVMSNNMSTSTLYRLIENARASLFIDEQEKLKDPGRMLDFRTLLLSGYKRGSVVYRTEKSEKDRLVPHPFHVFGFKALANIGGLEDVLEDRTITIVLRRSMNREKTDRDVDEKEPKWMEIRTKLVNLFFKYHDEVTKIYSLVKNAISPDPKLDELVDLAGPLYKLSSMLRARNRELWIPIITLAVFFERHGVQGLVERLIPLVRRHVSEVRVEDSTTTDGVVIATLLDIIDEDKWIGVSELTGTLAERLGVKKLDPRQVGRMLTRLGFREKRQVKGLVEYYIQRNDLLRLAKVHGLDVEEEEEHVIDVRQAELSVSDYVRSHGRVRDTEVIEALRNAGLSYDEAIKVINAAPNIKFVKDEDGVWWLEPA